MLSENVKTNVHSLHDVIAEVRAKVKKNPGVIDEDDRNNMIHII